MFVRPDRVVIPVPKVPSILTPLNIQPCVALPPKSVVLVASYVTVPFVVTEYLYPPLA